MCVSVQGFIQDFEFWEGGEVQNSVLPWRGCIAHNNLGGVGLGACSPRFKKYIDALGLILRHSGGTSSQL